ncbi:hypothetical protein ACH5RR_007756 [Cinchona calisaya]|uniref:C2H2-type domain-containing protein n=1 Tax=Cinchona calisaya TaxID=153742 RepID=A0ABD3A9M0_9GENT
MTEKRKENIIMSVELAIQREIAYREKIASFLSETQIADLLPLKVQSSTTLTSPEKATSSSIDCLQNQQQQTHHIYNRSDTFCKLCKVSCTSHYNYKQHMRGQKHKKAKLQHSPELNKNQQPRCNLCQVLCPEETSLRLHLNGQKHKARLRIIELGEEGKTSHEFWCELCQVPCTNEETFQLHLKGKSHVARRCALEEQKKTV